MSQIHSLPEKNTREISRREGDRFVFYCMVCLFVVPALTLGGMRQGHGHERANFMSIIQSNVARERDELRVQWPNLPPLTKAEEQKNIALLTVMEHGDAEASYDAMRTLTDDEMLFLRYGTAMLEILHRRSNAMPPRSGRFGVFDVLANRLRYLREGNVKYAIIDTFFRQRSNLNLSQEERMRYDGALYRALYIYRDSSHVVPDYGSWALTNCLVEHLVFEDIRDEAAGYLFRIASRELDKREAIAFLISDGWPEGDRRYAATFRDDSNAHIPENLRTSDYDTIYHESKETLVAVSGDEQSPLRYYAKQVLETRKRADQIEQLRKSSEFGDRLQALVLVWKDRGITTERMRSWFNKEDLPALYAALDDDSLVQHANLVLCAICVLEEGPKALDVVLTHVSSEQGEAEQRYFGPGSRQRRNAIYALSYLDPKFSEPTLLALFDREYAKEFLLAGGYSEIRLADRFLQDFHQAVVSAMLYSKSPVLIDAIDARYRTITAIPMAERTEYEHTSAYACRDALSSRDMFLDTGWEEGREKLREFGASGCISGQVPANYFYMGPYYERSP